MVSQPKQCLVHIHVTVWCADCGAAGAVLIEAKPPTHKEAVSLVVLVTGVGISIFEGSDTRATAHGILLCVLGRWAGMPLAVWNSLAAWLAV